MNPFQEVVATCSSWNPDAVKGVIAAIVVAVGAITAALTPFFMSIRGAVKENTQVTQANTDDRAVKSAASQAQLAAIATKVDAPVISTAPSSDSQLAQQLLEVLQKHLNPPTTTPTPGASAGGPSV